MGESKLKEAVAKGDVVAAKVKAKAMTPQQGVEELKKIAADVPAEDSAAFWRLVNDGIQREDIIPLMMIGWRNYAKIAAAVTIIVAVFSAGTATVMKFNETVKDEPKLVDVDFTPLIKAMKTDNDALRTDIKALGLKIDNRPAPTPDGPTPTPTVPIIVEGFVDAQIGKTTRVPYKAVASVTFTVYPKSRIDEVFTDGQLIHITPQTDGEFSIDLLCVAGSKIATKTVSVKAGKGPQPPPKPPTPAPPIIDETVLQRIKYIEETTAAILVLSQSHEKRLTALEKSPTPKPDPPKPDPPKPEPTPAPIPVAGFRVLIVFESMASLPIHQHSVVYGSKIRDYMQAKCATGSDGVTKEWRIFDKDIDASTDSPLWAAAMKRPRASVPWIVVSNGKEGFEGPLPANVTEALTLLKKYGGE